MTKSVSLICHCGLLILDEPCYFVKIFLRRLHKKQGIFIWRSWLMVFVFHDNFCLTLHQLNRSSVLPKNFNLYSNTSKCLANFLILLFEDSSNFFVLLSFFSIALMGLRVNQHDKRNRQIFTKQIFVKFIIQKSN